MQLKSNFCLKFNFINHLVITQGLDERVCFFQTSIHEECDADGQPSQDLLVLSLLCVGHHVLDRGLGLRTKLNQTHRKSGGLTCHGIVLGKKSKVLYFKTLNYYEVNNIIQQRASQLKCQLTF
jgi:hypothetical protein